jgi:U3 small nucleolar RNA-associated protein 15
VHTFDHGKPVEALAMAGAGSTFVSAGGNYLKCWDMVAAKVLTTVSNHQKTITGAVVRNGCSSDVCRHFA